MALGKKVAIFDWEWGRNSATREGAENPLSDLGLHCLSCSCWQETFVQNFRASTVSVFITLAQCLAC